jgi:hypothetical protein
MTKFELGKKYTCKSVGDHNCTFCFEVESRTEKMVTVRKIENWTGSRAILSNKVKVFVDGEEEYIYPMGRYSMAPVLRATQEYK